MTIEYIMVAALATDPTQHVYWAALNEPDYEGLFSGYSAFELILPAVVDYMLSTPIVGTGNTVLQGLASGDLAGVYPSPTVVGIQTRPVSPSVPFNGATLIWSEIAGEWIPSSQAAAGSTTVAASSNGATLPQTTINVGSTVGFPSSGTLLIQTSNGLQLVTYTGITPTSFTGVMGGTGTLTAGASIVTATSTTISPASNGVMLPQSTINVASTAGFPSSGTLIIQTSNGFETLTYTDTTPTSFTGVSGGSGTIVSGGLIAVATNNPTGVTTTVAPGSNGATFPLSTIYVASTVGFPTSGTLLINTSNGPQIVTYTGITPTSFTGVSGGSGTLSSGDIITSGGATTNNNNSTTITGGLLPPFSYQQFAALIENPGGVPVFQRLTQDMILPSYTVNLGGGMNLQTGQTLVHPAFTASYSQTPITAVLTDSSGGSPQNVITTPGSFASPNTYAYNTFGAEEVFTLTSSNGAVQKTATTVFTWLELSFYGIGPAGGNDETFIHGLSGQYLTNVRGTTFSAYAPANNEYIYFACRTAYGTPIFSVGGFVGGFNLVSSSITVHNAYGVADLYQLWVSDNPGLGQTTVTVS